MVPIGDEQEKEILNSLININVPEGYLTRLVANQNELAEKVRIIEAGLDDRVIELCKHLAFGDLCEEQPIYRNCKVKQMLYFPNKELQHTVLYLYELNGKAESFFLDFKDGYYKMLEEWFQDAITKKGLKKFDEVNRKWANEIIALNKELHT